MEVDALTEVYANLLETRGHMAEPLVLWTERWQAMVAGWDLWLP
jgi:hypothetical protein